MAILMVGLLGVAALIPLGKVAMTETDKSDRTGACGRAGLREVKIRGMLEPNAWAAVPTQPFFVIDPLGCTNTALVSEDKLGGAATSNVERINLSLNGTPLTAAQANALFYWQDDLTFVLAKDIKNPTNGERPVPEMSGGEIQNDGKYSWFFTVSASPAEVAAGYLWPQRRQFNVSIVVCWRRLFEAAASNETGEATIPVVCDGPSGLGGIGIAYPYDDTKPMPKENEWVLLTALDTTSNIVQASWYRVVSIANDEDPSNPTVRATLVGPDWVGNGTRGGTDGPPVTPFSAGNNQIKLIYVRGVTGVYTTTVQLGNDDLIWTR